MKTIAIIQARLGSTRLPGKALADIHGRPMLRHVIDRVRQIGGVDHIVVATPFVSDTNALGKAVSGVDYWTGVDLRAVDVLGRFAKCAKAYQADAVLRVTGDCPMLNPRIAEQVLALYHSTKGCEYASNVTPGYVDGEDVEVFSAEALAWAHREAKDPFDREHVTPWVKRHVKKAILQPRDPRYGVKTSVDTIEDLERVRALMAVAYV